MILPEASNITNCTNEEDSKYIINEEKRGNHIHMYICTVNILANFNSS